MQVVADLNTESKPRHNLSRLPIHDLPVSDTLPETSPSFSSFLQTTTRRESLKSTPLMTSFSLLKTSGLVTWPAPPSPLRPLHQSTFFSLLKHIDRRNMQNRKKKWFEKKMMSRRVPPHPHTPAGLSAPYSIFLSYSGGNLPVLVFVLLNFLSMLPGFYICIWTFFFQHESWATIIRLWRMPMCGRAEV